MSLTSSGIVLIRCGPTELSELPLLCTLGSTECSSPIKNKTSAALPAFLSFLPALSYDFLSIPISSSTPLPSLSTFSFHFPRPRVVICASSPWSLFSFYSCPLFIPARAQERSLKETSARRMSLLSAPESEARARQHPPFTRTHPLPFRNYQQHAQVKSNVSSKGVRSYHRPPPGGGGQEEQDEGGRRMGR